MFVMGSTVDSLLAGKALATAQQAIKSLVSSPVTAAELEQARSEVTVRFTKELAKPEGLAAAWVDIDTYGLPPVAEQMGALNTVSPGDLQRAATRLFSEGAFASVVVGNSELVKPLIERYGKVELLGELEPVTGAKPQTKSDQNATKPPPNPATKPE